MRRGFTGFPTTRACAASPSLESERRSYAAAPPFALGEPLVPHGPYEYGPLVAQAE